MRYEVALIFGILCFSVTSASAEAPKTPEGVLAALEETYAAGDFEAFAAMLAPGYEFLSQQGNELTRDQELEMMRPLFDKTNLKLEFGRDFTLRQLPEPDTWVLPHLTATLSVRKGEQFNSVQNVVTIWLRRNPETGLIQISRWIEEPIDAGS